MQLFMPNFQGSRELQPLQGKKNKNKKHNIAKHSDRFNCFNIITVCHIFCFFYLSEEKTHQMHKITAKRKAVTFEKVDQRRSEV